MYRVEGRIRGVAPILFNRMLEGALEEKKGSVSKQVRIDDAYKKVYRDEKGLYWPGWNFKRCLIQGAHRRRIKAGGNTLLSTVLPGVVYPDRKLYFGKDEPDFLHEHWGRIPPGPRGKAIIVRRPALEAGWELPFGLNVVDDRRTPEMLRQSLDEAGLLVGMGSWRPEYGRFIVTEWQVDEDWQMGGQDAESK